MPTITIHTSPIGSQLTSTIDTSVDPPEPDSKNDFPIFITGDGNFTLEQSDVDLSSGYSIQSFDGSGCTYTAMIRPPETAGTLTVEIAENAVPENNPAVSHDIRISEEFPDADAQAPTLLFDHGITGLSDSLGIAVLPTLILVYRITATEVKFAEFEFDGTSIQTQTLTGQTNPAYGGVDYINGDLLAFRRQSSDNRILRYDLANLAVLTSGEGIPYAPESGDDYQGIAHTRLGYAYTKSGIISTLPYGSTDATAATDHDLSDHITIGSTAIIAHQSDLIYIFSHSNNQTGVVEIGNDDTLTFYKHINIDIDVGTNDPLQDVAIYRDTFYFGHADGVYTLDARPFRPMAKNTKQDIYPVIIRADATIDLTDYAPDAETIIFDVGFDLPSWLSISSNSLTVDTTSITETTVCFVMLKGINYIDSTETGTFGFYLIVMPLTAPVWKSVSELTMRANSTYNLRQLVTADSITFRTGRTQPTGSSISDGVFTIGTTSGAAEFTATANSLDSHISLEIDVIQAQSDLRGARLRYKVEIEGIAVSADLLNAPVVSENLDPIAVNESQINEATIQLKNINKYDINKADNFWATNNLNAGGFQNAIKVYTEHFINDAWVENLLFSGVILGSTIRRTERRAFFEMNCVDASHILQNILPRPFGNLTKYTETRKATEEETYEGTYTPETSVLPIQPTNGQAWTDKTELTLSSLMNASEGAAVANSGYLTNQDFRTAGGFVETNPLLEYKTLPRGADIEGLLKQLAVGESHGYNIEIDLTPTELSAPYILNRGNISHNIETTRTTLLPMDWVYDATADRIIALLSNPEKHIQSRIVEYSLTYNTYRTLHTLPKGAVGYRIQRQDSTNYYALTSDAITQDRSATTLPRPDDKTGYTYDSITEGSVIRIHHYDVSTNTLTEFVPEDDDRPPQLGIHYWIGEENKIYIDSFEGIVPHDRGAFAWYDSNLYYRYAKDGEFGIARANTSGTTSEMISYSDLSYHNHLNFAFDINTTNGDLYMVSASSTTYDDTLLWSGNITATAFTSFYSTTTTYTVPRTIRIGISTTQPQGTGTDAVRVTGTDADGNTKTVTLTRPTGTTSISQNFEGFATITNIEGRATFTNTSSGSVRVLAASASTLEIKKRDSGGTETTPLTDLKGLSELTDLDSTGGAYLGCHEALFYDENLYMLVPIQRVDEDDGVYSRNRKKAAGCILYRCDVNAATPTLTKITSWDFVTHSGCCLTVHDSAVYYVENSIASAIFRPINPDL